MYRHSHPSLNCAWSLLLVSFVAMAEPVGETDNADSQSLELLKEYCESVEREEDKNSDEYRSVCPETFDGAHLEGYETIDESELESRLSEFEVEIARLDESISSLEKTRNSLRSELRRREVDWNSQVPGIKTAVRPVSLAELDDLRERISNVQFEIDKLESAREVNEARYRYLKSMKDATYGEEVKGSK